MKILSWFGMIWFVTLVTTIIILKPKFLDISQATLSGYFCGLMVSYHFNKIWDNLKREEEK